MKTKEEMLGPSFYPHECGSMIDCVTRQDALRAMEEYATQSSDAVEFADLIKHNDVQSFIAWFDNTDIEYSDSIEYCLQQFSIFLKEKGAKG